MEIAMNCLLYRYWCGNPFGRHTRGRYWIGLSNFEERKMLGVPPSRWWHWLTGDMSVQLVELHIFLWSFFWQPDRDDVKGIVQHSAKDACSMWGKQSKKMVRGKAMRALLLPVDKMLGLLKHKFIWPWAYYSYILLRILRNICHLEKRGEKKRDKKAVFRVIIIIYRLKMI